MESDCASSSSTAESPNAESKFAIFLENNDSPSQSVVTEIKSLISEPTQELKRKVGEIEVLRQAVTALEAECEAIHDATLEYELIQAPIRRLPPDILHEIFYQCLPTHRNPVISYTEAPLLLTYICRSWRSAALSSPRLWARLRIPLYLPSGITNDVSGGNGWGNGWPIVPSWEGDSNGENQREDAEKAMRVRQKVVKAWLSRSGSCPLSISLSYQGINDIVGPGENLNDNPISQIVDTILFFSSTIEELELLMPFSVYQTLLSDISPDRFPILRRLKVCFTGSVMLNGASTGTQIALAQVPNLQSLSNAPPILIFDPFSDALSTEHLTSLSLHVSISSMAAAKVLRRCRRLKHCTLTISNDPNAVHTDREDTIFLPDLLSLALSVDVMTNSSIMDLYRQIYPPRLTHFQYQQYVEYGHDLPWPDQVGSPSRPPTGVHYLLEKSNLLRKLSLDTSFLSTDDLLLCLRSSSQITHFQMDVDRKASRQNVYRYWNPNQRDIDLKLLIPPHDPKPDGTSGSGESYSAAGQGDITVQETLLPKLEVFEGHVVGNKTTDVELKEFILGRVGAAAEWNGVSSLKKVKMTFGRVRQVDFAADIQCVTREAGREDLELDLVYAPQLHPAESIYSPWYGLRESGQLTRDSDIWPRLI